MLGEYTAVVMADTTCDGVYINIMKKRMKVKEYMWYRAINMKVMWHIMRREYRKMIDGLYPSLYLIK